MNDRNGNDRLDQRRAVAACPECGTAVEVTRLASPYLAKFGEWNGVEDCRECSTALAFTVHLDPDGQVQVKCDRV